MTLLAQGLDGVLTREKDTLRPKFGLTIIGTKINNLKIHEVDSQKPSTSSQMPFKWCRIIGG